MTHRLCLLVLTLFLYGPLTLGAGSANAALPAQNPEQVKLLVEPSAQAPTIDLSEILNDPKQTRQRLGWMAALRVGMIAGSFLVNAENVRSQCEGSYCSALGYTDLENAQLVVLQTDAFNAASVCSTMLPLSLVTTSLCQASVTTCVLPSANTR